MLSRSDEGSRSKQCFNVFVQRLVAGAGFIKKRGAVARLALKSRVEETIELLPAVRFH
jgi:hypothetical protein